MIWFLISEPHIKLNVLLLPREKDDVHWSLSSNRFACLLSSRFVAVTVHCNLPPLRQALVNDTYKTCPPLSFHIFLVLCLDAKAFTHDLSANSAILLTKNFSLTISLIIFFLKFGPYFSHDKRKVFCYKLHAASLQGTNLKTFPYYCCIRVHNKQSLCALKTDVLSVKLQFRRMLQTACLPLSLSEMCFKTKFAVMR